MPVVPLKDVLDRAFKERYGVAAFNIVNDLTLEAVLAAAVELRAPVIVQTSVKTVKSIGRDVLYGMWRSMTAGIEVPVTLHLDHAMGLERVRVREPGHRVRVFRHLDVPALEEVFGVRLLAALPRSGRRRAERH